MSTMDYRNIDDDCFTSDGLDQVAREDNSCVTNDCDNLDMDTVTEQEHTQTASTAIPIQGSRQQRDYTDDICEHLQQSDNCVLIDSVDEVIAEQSSVPTAQSNHIPSEKKSTSCPVSMLADSKHSVFETVMLAQWDNIMGPKIRQLWLTDSNDSEVTKDMSYFTYLARYTLSGEICRDVFERAIDSKLYMLNERSLLIHTFIFSAISKGDLAIHTLLFVLPLSCKTYYMKLYELMETAMQMPISSLRVLLEKGPTSTALSTFSSALTSIVHMLMCLRTAPIPNYITIHDTVLHNSNSIPEKFLKQAISSHLMTSHRSIVRGHHLRAVNQMVSTLSLFMSEEERAMSCYATDSKHWQYNPNLYLQGILYNDAHYSSLDLTAACLSSTPTTLVDLTRFEVSHTPLHHRHKLLRHYARTQKLEALWAAKIPVNTNMQRHLFRLADYPETLVTNFLHEFQLIPETGERREAYSVLFKKMLNTRALALITYLNTESNHGTKPLTTDGNLKKVRHDLGLSLTADFNIVLAAADKLRPGIYSYVRADEKRDMEKMLKLLD